MSNTTDEWEWLDEIKFVAITKFHENHEDGDIAIYDVVQEMAELYEQHIEQIIGEDDQEENAMILRARHRNNLRAEQRERLKGNVLKRVNEGGEE